MGELTATFSLVIFILVQFLQGLGFDLFLSDCSRFPGRQYLWIIADCALFLVWLWLLWKYRSTVVRAELYHVPSLALGWALYLILCLLPRLWIWQLASFEHDDGGDFECGHGRSDTMFRNYRDALGNFKFTTHPLLTMLGITMTVMLIALTMASHAQHGLSSKYSLQYDMSSAIFAVIDGLNLLQILSIGVGDPDRGRIVKVDRYADMNHGYITPSSLVSGILNTTICRSTQPREPSIFLLSLSEHNDSSTNATVQCATEDIGERVFDHGFRVFVLFIATCCFVLPTIGLWQMKRESSKLKADEKLHKKTWSYVLRHANSELGQQTAAPANGTPRAGKKRMKKSGQTLSFKTWNKKGKTMIRRMARKRIEKEKSVYSSLERDVKRLQLVSSLWGLVLIDIPGLCIRLLAGFKYQQTASVLILKNILSIFLACVHLTVTYFQPIYHRLRGLQHDRRKTMSLVPDLKTLAVGSSYDAMMNGVERRSNIHSPAQSPSTRSPWLVENGLESGGDSRGVDLHAATISCDHFDLSPDNNATTDRDVNGTVTARYNPTQTSSSVSRGSGTDASHGGNLVPAPGTGRHTHFDLPPERNSPDELTEQFDAERGSLRVMVSGSHIYVDMKEGSDV